MTTCAPLPRATTPAQAQAAVGVEPSATLEAAARAARSAAALARCVAVIAATTARAAVRTSTAAAMTAAISTLIAPRSRQQGDCNDLGNATQDCANQSRPARAQNAVGNSVTGHHPQRAAERMMWPINRLRPLRVSRRNVFPHQQVEHGVFAQEAGLMKSADALPQALAKCHGAGGA